MENFENQLTVFIKNKIADQCSVDDHTRLYGEGEEGESAFKAAVQRYASALVKTLGGASKAYALVGNMSAETLADGVCAAMQPSKFRLNETGLAV